MHFRLPILMLILSETDLSTLTRMHFHLRIQMQIRLPTRMPTAKLIQMLMLNVTDLQTLILKPILILTERLKMILRRTQTPIQTR